jgi:hypothetical protein
MINQHGLAGKRKGKRKGKRGGVFRRKHLIPKFGI